MYRLLLISEHILFLFLIFDWCMHVFDSKRESACWHDKGGGDGVPHT